MTRYSLLELHSRRVAWRRWSAVRSCWSTSPRSAWCCGNHTVSPVNRYSTTSGNCLPLLVDNKSNRRFAKNIKRLSRRRAWFGLTQIRQMTCTTYLWFLTRSNIFEFDFHVNIPVGSRLFVKESQRMTCEKDANALQIHTFLSHKAGGIVSLNYIPLKCFDLGPLQSSTLPRTAFANQKLLWSYRFPPSSPPLRQQRSFLRIARLLEFFHHGFPLKIYSSKVQTKKVQISFSDACSSDRRLVKMRSEILTPTDLVDNSSFPPATFGQRQPLLSANPAHVGPASVRTKELGTLCNSLQSALLPISSIPSKNKFNTVTRTTFSYPDPLNMDT